MQKAVLLPLLCSLSLVGCEINPQSRLNQAAINDCFAEAKLPDPVTMDYHVATPLELAQFQQSQGSKKLMPATTQALTVRTPRLPACEYMQTANALVLYKKNEIVVKPHTVTAVASGQYSIQFLKQMFSASRPQLNLSYPAPAVVKKAAEPKLVFEAMPAVVLPENVLLAANAAVSQVYLPNQVPENQIYIVPLRTAENTIPNLYDDASKDKIAFIDAQMQKYNDQRYVDAQKVINRFNALNAPITTIKDAVGQAITQPPLPTDPTMSQPPVDQAAPY